MVLRLQNFPLFRSPTHGYDETWVSPEQAEECKCPICLHVPYEAVAHSCGELFCQACWDTCRLRDPRCPSCRLSGSDAVPAHRERRTILNLQLVCQKCQEPVRLGDKQHHQATCSPPPLEAHTAQYCPRRTVVCLACSTELTAGVMFAHFTECPHRMVNCLHRGERGRLSELEAIVEDGEESSGRHIEMQTQENARLQANVQRLREQRNAAEREVQRLRPHLRWQLQGQAGRHMTESSIRELLANSSDMGAHHGWASAQDPVLREHAALQAELEQRAAALACLIGQSWRAGDRA
mmetsp:Transcript_120735/g.337962  ORF Transcript_120735/g.337962 Transcript_120735/m.337962 type:complete len:294 (-) Transcript_120735:350-1231(-)